MASVPSARDECGPLARWSSRRGVAVGLILLAVAVAYGGSVRAPFLFDDTGAILNNPTIRHFWSWTVFSPPADGSTTTGRPLANFSFALNYAIGGESAWSYHVLNILIHAAASLLVFGCVRRTLRTPVTGETGLSVASEIGLTVALLWAVHPLQTESVICVAQRTESLCGLFYLLTLYAFIRAVAPNGRESSRAQKIWLTVSLVSSVCGMATKEVMVTAPLMVWLYDRTFLAGSFSGALRQRRGFYVALAGTWLLLMLVLWQSGGTRGVAAGFGVGVSWWHYLLTQCRALVIYLKLAVWPHPLVLDYGTGVVRAPADVWWQGVVVIALLATTVWALLRKPALGFVAAWFFLILAPSSSVVPLVTQTIAEHRMYLPLAAPLVLFVLGGYRVVRGRVFGVAGAAIALLLVVTVIRNRDFRDNVSMWRDNVVKRPEVARGHNNLAGALQQQGRFAEANEQFAQAVALAPDYITAYYSWGVALLAQGRPADAIARFEAAVRLAPNHPDAHLNLGNAFMQVRRPAEALPHYEQALRLKPAADVHYDLGVALMDLDRLAEAEAHFRAALQQVPTLAEAQYRLGRIAERGGRLADAERDYEAVLRREPNHAGAHAQLGVLLARSDRLAAAAEQLEAAVRLSPGDADFQASLGNVFLFQNRVREAIARYEESLRLRPNDPRTRENLQLAREALH